MFSLVSTESMDAETELLQVCMCRLYTCCYSPCKFVWALLTKILIAFYWSCLRNSHSHILKEISGIHAKGSEVFLHGTWRDSLASWLFAPLTNAPNLRLVTAGEVCWRQRWYAKLPKLIDLTWKCCSLLRQKKKKKNLTPIDSPWSFRKEGHWLHCMRTSDRILSGAQDSPSPDFKTPPLQIVYLSEFICWWRSVGMISFKADF